MNTIVYVLSLVVGALSFLYSVPMLMLMSNAADPEAIIHPVICAAAAVSLVVGVIMARRQKVNAVKVLGVSVVLFVLALLTDPLGMLTVGIRAAGIIWSVIAVIFAVRGRRKAAS